MRAREAGKSFGRGVADFVVNRRSRGIGGGDSGADLNGKAAQAAAVTIRERLTTLAREKYGTAEDAVHFADGHVQIGAQQIAFAALARAAHEARVSLSAIGFYRTPMWPEAEPATVTALDLARTALEHAGARVDELAIAPAHEGLSAAQDKVMGYEMARSLADERLRHSAELSPRIKSRLAELTNPTNCSCELDCRIYWPRCHALTCLDEGAYDQRIRLK